MESKPSYQRQDAVPKSNRERPKGTLTWADKGWIVSAIAEYWQRYSDLLTKGDYFGVGSKSADVIVKEAENRVAVLLSEEEKQETAPLLTVYIYVVVMEGCAKTAWYSMADALDWLMSEFGEHNIHYMHTDDDRYIIGYADGSAMFHISQVPLAASRDE